MKRAWLLLVVAANLAFFSTVALGADRTSGEQFSHLIDLTLESLNTMEKNNKEIREWNETHSDRLKKMRAVVEALTATYGTDVRANVEAGKKKINDGVKALESLHSKDEIRSIVDFLALMDSMLKDDKEMAQVKAYVQKLRDITAKIKTDAEEKAKKDPILQMRSIAHIPEDRSDWPTVENNRGTFRITERRETSTDSINDVLRTLRAAQTLHNACLTPAAFEAETKKIQALVDAQQAIIDTTVPGEIRKALGDADASLPVLLRKELDKHMSFVIRKDDDAKLDRNQELTVDSRKFTQESLIEEVKNLIALEMLSKDYSSKVHPKVVEASDFIKDIPEGDVGNPERFFNAFPTVKSFIGKVEKAKLKFHFTKFESTPVKDVVAKVETVRKTAIANAQPAIKAAEAKKQAALAEIKKLQARIASLAQCQTDRGTLDARVRGTTTIPTPKDAKEIHDGYRSVNERTNEAIRPSAPVKKD